MIQKSNAVSCQQLLVATSTAGHVTVCPDCGQVHLSLPALTLRLDTEVFRQLAGMLRVAQQRLETDPALQRVELAAAMRQVVRH